MFDFSLIDLSLFKLTLCILISLCLDKVLGEATQFHPLIGFGKVAHYIEKQCNKGASQLKLKGCMAIILCILPFVLFGYFIDKWLNDDIQARIVFSSFVLYICIGWRSLLEHGKAVFTALSNQDLTQARDAVSRIVSRDCRNLNESEVAAATTESILENGADAIFSAIFWFLIAGIPGVICYRLANTLDAMWGYKNERFADFGWAAARFDDVLNYIPARLTALSYALSGRTKIALTCWFTQAKFWKSPNAGAVMASGAGALQVSLGGKAVYHGTTYLRPLLGVKLTNNSRATSNSIKAACNLINRSLRIWLIILILASLLVDIHSTSILIEDTVELVISRIK